MKRTRRRRKRRKTATSSARGARRTEDYSSLVRTDTAGLPFLLHADPAPESDPESAPAADASAPAAEPAVPAAESPAPVLRDPTEDELLSNAARGAALRGELDRAVAIYTELLTEQPDHLEARHALGLLLEQAGRAEEAVEQLNLCVSQAPDEPRYLTARGAVFCGIQRFGEAEADLAASLEKDPANVDTHFHYGRLKSRKGLWSEALPFLRRSVELDPGCAAAYLHLGDALNHIDDLNGALQAYQRSAELGPTNAKALYGLGMVYDRLNQPDEAAVMYRRSRELAGT